MDPKQRYCRYLDWCVKLIIRCLKLFSRFQRRRFAYLLGYLIFTVSTRTQKRAISNVINAMPDLTRQEARNLALKAYQNTVLGVFECFWLEQLDYRVSCDALAAQHLASEQGAVVVTLHMGCYELVPFVVQQQTQRSATISNIPIYLDSANEIYQRAGIRCINKKHPQAFFKLIEAVKNKLNVCIHSDHYADDLELEFFGRKTGVPSGAAVLSRIGKKPLILSYAIHKPDGTYLINFKFIEILEGTCKDKVQDIMQQVYEQFELIILQHPDQWYWSYNRWR